MSVAGLARQAKFIENISILVQSKIFQRVLPKKHEHLKICTPHKVSKTMGFFSLFSFNNQEMPHAMIIHSRV
jgi:hypothetical protein